MWRASKFTCTETSSVRVHSNEEPGKIRVQKSEGSVSYPIDIATLASIRFRPQLVETSAKRESIS